MSVHSPNLFSESQSDSILAAIASGSQPLSEIAATHNTTIAPLCSWLESPEISARLEAIEHTIARRTRLLAAPHLKLATTAVAEVLRSALNEERAEQASDPERTARRRAEIRKSAALLARLSNFTFKSRTQPPGRTAPSAPRRERPEPTATDFNALLAHVESEAKDAAPTNDRFEDLMAVVRARPGGAEREESIRAFHRRRMHDKRLDKLEKFLNHPDPAVSRRAAVAILKLNSQHPGDSRGRRKRSPSRADPPAHDSS